VKLIGIAWVKQLGYTKCSVNKDLLLSTSRRGWACLLIFFGKGLRVQFTYGKRNKSVILLRYTIGTLKVNRVEIVWFFLNNVSHGEQSSWWCKLQCSGNSYKIKRYCHPLPPHAKNKGQIK
jgi:hypothetical protein